MYDLLLGDKFQKNKILSSQQGNILVVILLTMSIGSAIFLYMMSSDKVTQSISELKSTQDQIIVRGEISNNLAKLFSNKMGASTVCSSSVATEMKDKFTNFEATSENAKFAFDQQFSDSPPGSDAFNNQYVKCLINPNKFPNMKIVRLVWNSVRTSEPNLVSMTSEISTNIVLMVKGSKTVNKFEYNYKHRIKPRSLDDYALIYADYQNEKLILSPEAKVTIMGKTLIYSGTSNPSLTNIVNLKASEPKITYLDQVEISGTEISISENDLVDLGQEGRSLSDSIPSGIVTNAMANIAAIPWISRASEYEDELQYDYLSTNYILPKTTGKSSAILNIPYVYNLTTIKKNTADIFGPTFDSPNYQTKEGVSSTCKQSQSGYGQFNVLIFNNLNQDFTIDLSANDNEPDNELKKAVFCGAVAAKKIIVKLNNRTESDRINNYIIGKFITREGIQVEGVGHLFILDGLTFKNSDISFPLPGSNLSSEVSTQLYMLKFYMTQNFFVPFFTQDISSINPAKSKFFLASSIKNFFTDPCVVNGGDRWCRKAIIESPETKDILPYKDYLVYEALPLD
jgi:hypothetical protein